MKKRLALILSAIMMISVLFATFGATTVSAATAGDDHIDAIMSNVMIDCVCSETEYVMDTVTENFHMGAAWNESEGILYLFTIDSVGGNYTVDIGGKTLKVDSNISGIDGVEGISAAGYTELAIPIDQLSLGYNGTYATVDMKITTSSSGTEFDGKVIFTDYSNVLEYNQIVQSVTPGVGCTINGRKTDNTDKLYADRTVDEYTVSMVDNNADETKARVYCDVRHASLMDKSNQYFEFDIKANALPMESFFAEDQGKYEESAHTRLWIVMKYASNSQIYLNIINSAEGITLLIQRLNMDPEIVSLGKQLGEKFTLTLVNGSEGDFLVRVDGKTVAKTDNVTMGGSKIGSSKGVNLINTGRNNALPAGGIDVEISNVSAGLRNTEYDSTNGIYYDLDALLALSTTRVDKNVTEDSGSGSEDKNFVISGATILTGGSPIGENDGATGEADGAESDNDGAEADDAESGCGSSVAGMGIVMVLGSAIGAVVATRKKDD